MILNHPRLAVIIIGALVGNILAQAVPGIPNAGIPVPSPQAQPASTRVSASTTIFLPLVIVPSGFSQNPAIWVYPTSPAAHEVALFRRTFTLDELLSGAALAIFADTRYQVWLDGAWIGRGPARFSRLTHEYDLYPLGDLGPGEHLLAALVQWAPNTRRSESTTPYLQASVQGKQNGKPVVIERTGSAWKGLASDAWRQGASLVHAWGLIGPTELLDLSRLPPDWMLPSFLDSGWPAAVVKNPLVQDAPTRFPFQQRLVTPSEMSPNDTDQGGSASTIESLSAQDTAISVTYQPRSIAPLESTFRPVVVHAAGLISPGRALGELVPPVSNPYPLAFSALAATPFTVEVVSPSRPQLARAVQLDGQALNWVTATGSRPGVYTATRNLKAGRHQLSFSNISSQGLTFAVSTTKVHFSQIPFQQGINAGRRTLLADLSSQSDQVVISGNGELNAAFPNLPAYLVLDLGRVMQGRLIAQVSGPTGAIVDIGWDERLYQNARPLPYPGPLHNEWNQVDSWILDGASRSISTLDTRAGRYILITVWGNGPVRIDHIQVSEEHYPVQQVGSFASSDPLLNRIWQVGVDSAFINMSDAYTDTPWRERGQWWGDAYVLYHTNLAAFGDTTLLRRGLAFMAEAFQQGRPNSMAPNGDSGHMLDYGMLWAQSLKDYWQLTGDLLFVKQNFPVLKQFIAYLATFKNPTTGLLDIPQGPWATTTLIDWAGSTSRAGQSTAVNALYYKTLLDGATLAREIGEAAASSSWNGEAQTIKQSANRYLFSPGKGRYLSSILAGKPIAPSPHAQAWALACGLVPNDEIKRVAASLMELISSNPSAPNVEIYGMFWVLEGLGKAGYISEAINLIESYYGRLLDLGATNWWEVFTPNQYYSKSLSHGWGSSPTGFLTQYLLGAQRTEMNTWLIKPAFYGVRAASGSMPFLNGTIDVDWKNPGCGDLELNFSTPGRTKGQVVIPFYAESLSIIMNGNLIWQNEKALSQVARRSTDGIYIDLQGGQYMLKISGAQPPCFGTGLLTDGFPKPSNW